MRRTRFFYSCCLALALLPAVPAHAETEAASLLVPVNRSARITLAQPMAQVVLGDPSVADVYVANSTNLTVAGKRPGLTTLRLTDKEGRLLGQYDVQVSPDLPALRKELKNALPGESAGADIVNGSLAVVGRVSNAAASERAIKVARDYLERHSAPGAKTADILNLLQIAPGAPEPASAARPMEQAFLRLVAGAAGSAKTTPAVEGPVGFMLD